MNFHPCHRSRALWTRSSSKMCHYIAIYLSFPWPWLDGVPAGIQDKQFNICFMIWESVRYLLANCMQAVMFLLLRSGFCLATLLYRADWWGGAEIIVLNWFALWHGLSALGPYIEKCTPFQIMSKQLNLPQVDSNQAANRIRTCFVCHGKSCEYICTCYIFVFTFN